MDSTTLIDQIETAQAQKEVTANELFDAASPAMAYGRHASACDGLTWAYYGCRYGGTAVANGTGTIDASATTYMVVDLTTGAVSFSTGTTDWNSTTKGRAYKLTSGTATVTGWEDHRFGPRGVFAGGAGASSGPSPTVTDSTTARTLGAADAGCYVRYTNASAKTLTIALDATTALAADSEYHGRNVGAGDLTISPVSGVVVSAPVGGSLVIAAGGTFTLKRVAIDTFDLFGSTKP